MSDISRGNWVLRGGTLADGNGGEPYIGDIRLRGDRITDIGAVLPTSADRVIDVHGLVVSPGFIDMHVHADGLLARGGGFDAAVSQGVTTVVLGQDGCSFAPATADTLTYMGRYFGAVNGGVPASLAGGSLSVEQLLSRYQSSAVVNVAYLVPHGNLRMNVMGVEDRRATVAELLSMKQALWEAFDAGALGLSAGLEYVPSCFADVKELSALCDVVRERGGIFMCHMRSYGAGAPESIEEMRSVARLSGARVHISHLKGPPDVIRQMFAESARDGLRLTFDSYPYAASSTILAVQMLPRDAQSGGAAAVLGRLESHAFRKSLRTSLDPSVSDFFSRMIVSSVSNLAYEWCAGQSLASSAAALGQDPTDFACRLLVDCGLSVGVVGLGPGSAGYSDEDGRSLMKLPDHMAGSDGIYEGQHPHPRGWGSFARYLSKHTGNGGELSLPEAVAHLSTRAADRLRLKDRGRLLIGSIADLSVFDPETISDEATFEHPKERATGIRHVFVNGTPVLRDGKTTGLHTGVVLR